MQCTDDSQCPGFGQQSSDTFCVSGACVSCRAGMNDCPATAPVCDMGACRACTADADCESTICDVDSGMCVAQVDVIYAGPAGTDADACTLSAPCTIAKALNLVDAQHLWLRMLPGAYMPPSISITNTNVKIVATGATLDNVFSAPNLPNAFAANGCTGDTNVVHPEQVTANPGTNAILQDPMLVDPVNGDFHLQAGSPAIDAAKVTASDPPVDYEGTTRPQGPRDDIGAFEAKP